MVCFIILFTFMLSACDMGGGQSSPAKSPTATTSASKSTPSTSATATPAGIRLGAQTCPSAVSVPTYWDAIIATQANINKVESVACGNLEGNTTLQALVLVRNQGTGSILDVYVYSNITNPKPKKDFQLMGLYKGDAKISNYNTVVTAEVDLDSSVNKNQPNAGVKQDLYREFKWSDSSATLVPVSFPGIYPVLTRYEAEAEQLNVNKGQNFWERDATQTVSHFADKLLNWQNAQVTITSGGGQTDVSAETTVKSPKIGGGIVKVSMSRLEGNANGGIWIVTAVATDGLALTAPNNQDRISSPVSVAGKGNAFEGVVGTVKVLNHLYDEVGSVQAKGGGNGANTPFSASVTYTKTFKGGTEEGLVALFTNSQADGSIAGAVIEKELLA
ncbi:hypothetical protein KTT_11580 [Tengunoibacter tsumagoiensis]|uniref:Bacterial spore germination immunoglobulin-like domain-containing protein n=2 Tax=Tengunoibacter tsumagoiensis TaxID=2014871 RepID=A0A401ZWL1_9CHLR|nr:hypothetical protein KTT_11580 [Tengunoibacter tsumagoiensis]